MRRHKNELDWEADVEKFFPYSGFFSGVPALRG